MSSAKIVENMLFCTKYCIICVNDGSPNIKLGRLRIHETLWVFVHAGGEQTNDLCPASGKQIEAHLRRISRSHAVFLQ